MGLIKICKNNWTCQDGFSKKYQAICCFPEAQLKWDYQKVESKREKIYLTNVKRNQKSWKILEIKKKKSYLESITILNWYAPSNMDSKYIRQSLTYKK